jgi:hypothetical protein
MIWWLYCKLKVRIFNMRFKKMAEYARNAVIEEAKRMGTGVVLDDINVLSADINFNHQEEN